MVDYTNGTQANATGATTRKFTCVNKMPVRGAKMGDTVEKARAKVVAQLLANKQYLLGGEQAKQSAQECLEALDVAVERVNAGLCDAALKAAIAENIAAHNKRKAKA